MFKNVPAFISFSFLTWLLIVVIFFLFRIFFLVSFAEIGYSNQMCREAFSIGHSFDVMIASYIILLPVLLFSLQFLFEKKFNLVNTFSVVILKLLIASCLIICCIDIPYFGFFKSRITTSVLIWMDDGVQSFRFLVSEKKFYPFMLLILLLIFGATKTISLLNKKILKAQCQTEVPPYQLRLLLVVCALLFIVGGLRGFNKERAPGTREAFFTDNAFVNQLALNPVLTFFDSFSVFKIKYTTDADAIGKTQTFLGIKTPLKFSPLAREVKFDSSGTKKNIVLVLMEGMSANRMSSFGETKQLTPFLDSLAKHSLFYTNFYSCGIHTCNGVYGSLFGMPSLMAKHPLSNIESAGLVFNGLPYTLKQNGYTNLFFCTHGGNFDNMGYFLPLNNINRFFTSSDYPAGNEENVWGINDEFLFDFASLQLDSLYKRHEPFFTSILTISTHPPQALPKKTNFKPRSTIPFDQVFEFADYAIKKFMTNAAKKDWYKNTLFVFVADHGINLPSTLDAPLSLNHIPLIIFNPADTSSKNPEQGFGMQTDIFPTVMSLLKLPYVNNALGVNLQNHQRPFAFFSQDNKLGVINDSLYLIIDKSGKESMYRYKINQTENVLPLYKSIAAEMKTYAYSFLQTSQWMIENKKVGVE